MMIIMMIDQMKGMTDVYKRKTVIIMIRIVTKEN